MDEELKKAASEPADDINAKIADSIKDEYIPGSAAPKIEQPQQKPDNQPEPEKKPKPAPKPRIRRPSYTFSSALTVLGIVVVALCAFFLLSREVAIQRQQTSITDLKNSINDLYIERDSLYTQYNSSIDISAVRKRAALIGMHAPEDGQVVELD